MIARFLASIAFASVLIVSACQTAFGAAAARHSAQPIERLETLVFRGHTAMTKLSARRDAPVADAQFRRPIRYPADFGHKVRRRSSAFTGAKIPIPVAPNWPVVPADADFFGFPGLTDVDQFYAGTGAYANSQFEVEPPEQGLCVGNGFVVDDINNAVAVYSKRGTPLTAPTATSQFFQVLPEISAQTSSGQTYGPFLTGPKCYFDRDTQRWFFTESAVYYALPEPDYYQHSLILLAVSDSGDPTAGFSVYSIDTTTSDTPLSGFLRCPCHVDQPLLGADANGLFISADQLGYGQDALLGAQIYALSKTALANHKLPTIVHINVGLVPAPGQQYPFEPFWSSIQPAEAPDTSVTSRIHNGTEFFMSALDFSADRRNGSNDNRIAIWALTNTQSLRNAVPNLGFQHIVIASEPYGFVYNEYPCCSQHPGQKTGPAPLAAALRKPLGLIEAGEDQMTQVVFAGGRLWAGLTTGVRSGSNIDAGIAFFAVAPGFNGSGSLTAKIEHQGYVAVAGQNLMYPSIGVNAGGAAVMAATLSGPAYYPTAVYVTEDGYVHIAGPGTGPDDGYTGYDFLIVVPYEDFITGWGLWGRYSAAVAEQDGSIWIASEFIPGVRTTWTNWGTFIGHAQIHH